MCEAAKMLRAELEDSRCVYTHAYKTSCNKRIKGDPACLHSCFATYLRYSHANTQAAPHRVPGQQRRVGVAHGVAALKVVVVVCMCVCE